MLLHLWNDFRYAARRLSASPGFTVAAVATIALGVGVNTSIFSVINGFTFRDLPAPEAQELVSIHQLFDDATMRQRSRSGEVSDFSTSEYRTYRDSTRTLSGILGYSRPRFGVTLGGDAPQEFTGALVTCNYFDVLRQPPALGAGFANDCDAEGAAPAVVLGHDLWTSAFGADPTIVGRIALLNRQQFTVVGVAPAGMRGVDMVSVAFFVPISTQPLLDPSATTYRGEWSWLTLIGRKADGTSLDQVRAELGVIAAQIDVEQPPRKTTLIVTRARPASLEDRAQMLPAVVVVMTAFGLVLLIACANVANLLLARATGRSREIAVRLSLGASRGRVVQQLLVESIVIAVIGGALGALLALWSSQGLVALALSGLPSEMQGLMIDASADSRVLTLALVLTLASGALFGLAPALYSSKPDLHTAMKTESSGAGRRSGRLQGALLAGQVAISMVLMISAGLLLRGVYVTQTVEPGFSYENVAVASFDLTGAGYDAARAAVFQRLLTERVGALPGIDGVAQAQVTPLTPGGMGFMARLPDQDQPFVIRFNNVSANYFSLLGLPIIRGRAFADAELTVESGGRTGSGVMIVTEATARRFWPDRDPLGQTLMFGGADEPYAVRVVGIAKDAEITRIGEVPSDYAYFPTSPANQSRLQLLARSRMDFAATAAGIRAAAAELDPGLVVRVAPLEANLDIWRSLAGLVGALSTTLGALALVLAAVGIYGVVAYAVGLRLREIGIRRALGASARGVVTLMLKRTMRPVMVGAVVGVAVAAGISRILSSVLFGVSPLDPLGLGLATLFVIAVALAAGFLPARRATRVDPMTTLRYE
jgi:predicted permease